MAAFVVSRPLPIEDLGDLAAELTRLREIVAEVAAAGVDVVSYSCTPEEAAETAVTLRKAL